MTDALTAEDIAGLGSALILHHYDPSPYSEKVRLYLGYKGASWLSVQTPAILPKPDLLALTGGYRRAPVLQSGADIYCDSALILAELERRLPAAEPADAAAAARAHLLGYLVDVDVFFRIVRYVMGLRADQLPPALLADRAALHDDPGLAAEPLKAALPEVAAHLRLILAQLDVALGNSVFFGGERPASGDFAIYHALWFLQRVNGLATLCPQAVSLPAWLARMAAIGSGERREITAADAMMIASRAKPQALPGEVVLPGFAVGLKVHVMPEAHPREAVSGRLVQADGERLVIARETPAATVVHVHFPRLGYSIVADGGVR